MYLRSFQKLLYQNGKRVSETQEEALKKIDNKTLKAIAPTKSTAPMTVAR